MKMAVFLLFSFNTGGLNRFCPKLGVFFHLRIQCRWGHATQLHTCCVGACFGFRQFQCCFDLAAEFDNDVCGCTSWRKDAYPGFQFKTFQASFGSGGYAWWTRVATFARNSQTFELAGIFFK